jgi:hypothetical protein
MSTRIKGAVKELKEMVEPFAGKTFQIILALQIYYV